ncbi:MAG: alkaline phosphatase [Archangiaceae bacterium]|nr:alkaline phosphatase [Archangiaceae bacterium]
MGLADNLPVRRSAAFFCIGWLGCLAPPLSLEGKECSVEDPCPAPYTCEGATGAHRGTCRSAATPFVTVAAAGSIACDPSWPEFNHGDGQAGACQMKATAALLEAIAPDAVLVLGDTQRSAGSLSEYRASYDLAWGKFKDVTRPTPGTADYFSQGLGYFGYFGQNAGPGGRGYYSFDLGAWHLVSLNGECAQAGGCEAGSPQETWLREDLAASAAKCVLAFWKGPRFSSRQSDEAYAALWSALYQGGAELVLNGGMKQYERIGPTAPDGGADPARGLRTFVVGTGGLGGFDGFNTLLPTSELAHTDTHGVLELTLLPTRYRFRFRAALGDAFTDEGDGECHD